MSLPTLLMLIYPHLHARPLHPREHRPYPTVHTDRLDQMQLDQLQRIFATCNQKRELFLFAFKAPSIDFMSTISISGEIRDSFVKFSDQASNACHNTRQV